MIADAKKFKNFYLKIEQLLQVPFCRDSATMESSTKQCGGEA